MYPRVLIILVPMNHDIVVVLFFVDEWINDFWPFFPGLAKRYNSILRLVVRPGVGRHDPRRTLCNVLLGGWMLHWRRALWWQRISRQKAGIHGDPDGTRLLLRQTLPTTRYDRTLCLWHGNKTSAAGNRIRRPVCFMELKSKRPRHLKTFNIFLTF